MWNKAILQSVVFRSGAVACLALVTLQLVGCSAEPRVTPADTILKNGHIFTSNPKTLWVEAVAIVSSGW